MKLEQDRLLTAKEAAAHVGLSVPGFYRVVAEGRLPKPVYPASRSPRWFFSELDGALRATRKTPAEALVERRERKAARLKANARSPSRVRRSRISAAAQPSA